MHIEIFNKSRKNKGTIYVCESEIVCFKGGVLKDYMTELRGDGKRYVKSEFMNLGYTKSIYKYGKTKDIKNRLKMYGDGYRLLVKFDDVNHFSLREKLIHHSSEMTDYRYENMVDSRNEHVPFNPIDVVERYVSCDIKIENNFISLYDNGELFEQRSIGFLMKVIKI